MTIAYMPTAYKLWWAAGMWLCLGDILVAASLIAGGDLG